MNKSYKSKSAILMVVCAIIPVIRFWMLFSRDNIIKILNQKFFTANDSINIRLLTFLPILNIIEIIVFATIFLFTKSEKMWKRVYIVMILYLIISIFGFLVSIYNFA